MEKDYLYFINKLSIPKPADYPNFSVMLYTEIISSDDDPILYKSVMPNFETVSATSPFYEREDVSE